MSTVDAISIIFSYGFIVYARNFDIPTCRVNVTGAQLMPTGKLEIDLLFTWE